VSVQLKAGQMGDPAETGMPLAFQNSMAAAMEAALDRVRQAEGFPALVLNSNSSDDRDRRLIFVAIAQGMVEYLKANRDALTITVPSPLPTLPFTRSLDIAQADPL
jgi:hypothetical protein